MPTPARRPFHPEDDTLLSDAERNAAVERLGRAVGEGRLEIAEFDERSRIVFAARRRGELAGVLDDLGGGPLERTYTESEILAARDASRHPRAGVMVTGTALAAGAAGLFAEVPWGIPPLVFLLLFLVLYVAKAGPSRWYMPTPAQLERRRYRAARAEQRMRALERREARAEAAHDWGRMIEGGARKVVRRRDRTWHDGPHE